MFLMEVTHRVSVTMFLLCAICQGFSASRRKYNPLKLLVGRSSETSICNTNRVVLDNQTFKLTADGSAIKPPCKVYFKGFIKHNNIYIYKNVCFNITDFKIPCSRKNKIHITQWTFSVSANGSRISVILPSKEATFYCDSALADNTSIYCSNKPSVLQITMYIKTRQYNITPSITFNAIVKDNPGKSTLPSDDEGNSITTNMFNPLFCNCQGTNPYCKECKSLELVVNTDQDKGKDTKEHSGQKHLDINNIISVAGGIMTSLFVPVILIMIRNHIRQSRQAERENNEEGSDAGESENAADDEEDTPTNNLLGSQRPSCFSDEMSFYSADTSV